MYLLFLIFIILCIFIYIYNIKIDVPYFFVGKSDAGKCKNDKDCGPNMKCLGGKCVQSSQPTAPKCKNDKDCGPNMKCSGGKCVQSSKVKLGKSSLTSACKPGFVLNSKNQCVQKIPESGKCPANSKVSKDGKYCTSQTQLDAGISVDRRSGGSGAPTRAQLNDALSVLNNGGKPTAEIQRLLDGGFIYKQGSKYYSVKLQSESDTGSGKPPAGKGNIPTGQPRKKCEQWQQYVGDKCIRIPGKNSNYKPTQAGPQQPYLPSKQELQDPSPVRPTFVNIGGQQVIALFQWNDGGLRILDNGRTIMSTINPSSTDGSKSGVSTSRNRNEIAIKYLTEYLNNINFKASISGYENMKDNKSGIWFQIKPEGTSGDNNAVVRLGIENDGTVTIGRNDVRGKGGQKGDPMYTNLNINNMKGQPLDVSIKLNENGKNAVYINGRELKLADGQSAEFDYPSQSTTIKFGVETVKGTLEGDFGITYSDINFDVK